MKDTPSDIVVSLIGSYRKDPPGLKKLYELLSKQFTVISPESVDFVSQDDEFVKAAAESSDSILSIEEKHLQAIKMSDFVVLHAPKGYVGISGSLEVGFAYALGIPVIADEKPSDGTIAAMVTYLAGGMQDITIPTTDAGRGVGGLQQYYKRIAKRRGWDDESPRDTLLLLAEELGELARAVRQHQGLKRDGGYEGVAAAEELADVQLYLVHLASSLNIDLADAVTNKELKNSQRFDQ